MSSDLKNKKKYLVYAFRYVIMFAFLFTFIPQFVLIFYFLAGKTSKLVWLNYGSVIFAIKSIPIAVFATTLYAAITEWSEHNRE